VSASLETSERVAGVRRRTTIAVRADWCFC